MEEPTSYANADEQEESEQQSDEAEGKKSEEAEEENWWHKSNIQDGNDMFEIVGNSTSSSDKDIPNRQRKQFENEVADGVDEADGYAESETEDRVVNQQQQSSGSVF